MRMSTVGWLTLVGLLVAIGLVTGSAIEVGIDHPLYYVSLAINGFLGWTLGRLLVTKFWRMRDERW